MAGRIFAEAKYFSGHPEIGNDRIRIHLEVHSSNLTLRRRDNGIALLSIPWANIRNISPGVGDKNIAEDFLGSILRMFEFLPWNRYSDLYIEGLWLSYWDEEVQRAQEIFIGANTDRHRDKMINAIWGYRDQFYRGVNKQSGPQRR